MGLSSKELKEIETTLVDMLKNEIGPIIKSKAGTMFESYVDKVNDVDLVTQVDQDVEAKIHGILREKFPGFKFIGEETYVKGETQISDEPTFILDPIDGTTNFIHGFPYSCTSLGLSENKKPVVGVVYNPHLDQMFHASACNGAYLNNAKINVPKRKLTLQKSLIAMESGSERDDSGNFDIKAKTCKTFLSEKGASIHGVRSMGSAAMNMCYVASGMLDCYWEGGPWCWDVCAGICILNETGGICVGGNPGVWEIPLNGRCYLAVRSGASKDAQKQFIESFWKYVDGELVYEYKD